MYESAPVRPVLSLLPSPVNGMLIMCRWQIDVRLSRLALAVHLTIGVSDCLHDGRLGHLRRLHENCQWMSTLTSDPARGWAAQARNTNARS